MPYTRMGRLRCLGERYRYIRYWAEQSINDYNQYLMDQRKRNL